MIDSAAGYDKQSFIAQPFNNGNKTSSPFYQIQYLPSFVREHDTIKPPILHSVFLSPTHNLFKQCCFILWNLLGNIQHWKCLSYSALCPTPNLFFFETWRRKRVFLDCKFTREVLNFLQKKCFRYIDFVICVWLIGLPDSRTWPAFQDSSCWTRVLWWRGLWCETLHPWFDEISAVQTRGKPWDFSKQGTGKEFTGFHRF